MMAKSEFDTVFAKKILDQLPITYRYMIRWETNNVDEFNVGDRFSVSKAHRSWQYINHTSYKPNSNVYLKLLHENEESIF